MPRAGLKNRILYLQKPTRTISTTSGDSTETWSNVSLVYAEVIPTSGSETVEDGQNSAKMSYKVRVNYRPDITTERRFLIDGFAGQLNGAITTETTIAVDDSTFAQFKQTRRLRALKIDDEMMTVTGIISNNLTVSRGAFGTSIANHADNSKVILFRQLNIESVYDPTGRRQDLMCDCVEVT